MTLGKRARQGMDRDEMKRSLACLPSAPMYVSSYMHKDTVSHVLVSHRFEFIFTASTDGFLKFWKKAEDGIEFVKTFRAHLTKISGLALSKNEQILATVCTMEQTMKLFDVSNFDVIHIKKWNLPLLFVSSSTRRHH